MVFFCCLLKKEIKNKLNNFLPGYSIINLTDFQLFNDLSTTLIDKHRIKDDRGSFDYTVGCSNSYFDLDIPKIYNGLFEN